MNKIKIIIETLKKFIDELDIPKNKYNGSKLIYFIDWFFSYLFHGASPNDYIQYEMYEKTNRVRRDIITYRRQKNIDKKLNNYNLDTSIIGNKALFLKNIEKYVNRSFVYSKENSLAEIIKFLEDHKEAVFKPISSTHGKGVEKLENSTSSREFISKQYESNVEFILEEVIVPDKEISSINPNSVNSIRMYSVLKNNGEVKILGASLKSPMGKSFVDNLSAEGISFPIDYKNGIISHPGSAFLHDEKILYHPLTNKKMIGFEIPNYLIAVETVKECAKKFKDFRYLGWDIVITEEGIEIIEANLSPGPRILQSDGIYKYRNLKEYL